MSAKMHIIVCSLVLLALAGCRKDETSAEINFEGTYSGTENYTYFNQGSTVPDTDTDYVQSVEIQILGTAYEEEPLNARPYPFSDWQIPVYELNDSTFSFLDGDGNGGHSIKIRFSNDSLYLIYHDHFWGYQYYLTFSGVKS